MEKEVLKLINYLYGDNSSLNEPRYKRRREMIEQATSTYGDYGEHLHGELFQLLKGYAIENLTDWNYESCFRFDVLLHPGVPYTVRDEASAIELVQKLCGTAYFLVLEISAVGPYYRYFFYQEIYDPSNQTLIETLSASPFSADHADILKKVVRYCEGKGLKRLGKELLDRVVPDIALDLAEKGEVTIYNCLFADTYH
ncbi:hypothetical protein HYR99_21180 [Candidatus Poribacteria bacterium]|nr:hypothetical protein [Candidatus Poribacteria bacterium]